MNEIGITLAGLVLKVTLAMLPATALHLLASRRGPVAGSWMAGACLTMIVGITALALLPRPELGGEPTVATRTAGREPDVLALPEEGRREESAVGSPTSDRFLTLTRARAIWTRLESQLARPVRTRRPWAGIATFIALAGMGLGLSRLLLGLWAVRECRRRGTRIEDADLTRLLESLKTAMKSHAAIELLELSELATPATAGWRRPMVLLPDNWRSWSQSDLRAVLAHELAHIQRADYIVGLLARLAAALHFYHPMVLWMTVRLQAQQELAADAVGAVFAGGRGPYLAVLSRMALRQDGEISWWPARAFSPARGTLIRRIRMLKSHEESTDPGWARASRVLAAVLLTGIATGVWILPPPVQGGDGEKLTVVAPATQPVLAARSAVPAFDLSYIPDDAMGVVAFHPAATFRRQGMAQYADQLNALTAMKGIDKALEIPISKCPLKVEQIEQVTVGVIFDRKVIKGKEVDRFMIHGLAIRTVEPFDWVTLLRSWWPNATEMKEGTRVYYKVHHPPLGPNGCVFIPDNRTLVCDDERFVLPLIRRPVVGAPEFARGDDWKRVEHDLLAVILDNHDGRISRVTKKVTPDADEAQFDECLERSDRWTMGLADTDDFLPQFIATCRDPQSVQTIAKVVGKVRDSCLEEAHKPHKDEMPDYLRYQELAAHLLKNLRVEAGQTSLRVEPGGGVKLAELLPLIAKNGL